MADLAPERNNRRLALLLTLLVLAMLVVAFLARRVLFHVVFH